MTTHRSISALLLALVAGLAAGDGRLRLEQAPARRSASALPTSAVHFGTYHVVPLLGSSAPAYAGPATPHSLTGVKIVPAVQKLD